MIDHVEIQVGDVVRSTAFYQRALAPLGYTLHVTNPSASNGFGATADKLDFWVKPGTAAVPPPHFAFGCANRDVVAQAYDASIAAGGKDRGGPAVLPHIHPSYFAAFVYDPDGHLVEFVCHTA